MASKGNSPEAYVVEDDPDLTRHLSGLLAAMGFSSNVVTGERPLMAMPGRQGPAVMLVGLGRHAALRIAYASQAHSLFPAMVMIGYTAGYDAAVLSEAMAAGIRRVLRVPVEAATLRQAIDDVRHELRALTTRVNGGEDTAQVASKSPPARHAPPIPHQIVAVCSPKGGVGSSTLTINLAVALQVTGYATVTVDACFNFASHNVFLDLSPEHSIVELVEDCEDIAPEAVMNVLMEHGTGLHALLAPEHPEEGDNILYEHMQSVLTILKGRFACTVVDAWPCFDSRVLAALELADTILVPISPDLPAMKNISSYLRVMDLLHFDMDKIMPVLMRSDTVSPRELREIESVLKHDLKLRVVSDGPRTTNAANTGNPFVLSAPEAEVSQNVFDLAQFLIARATPQNGAAVPKRRSVMGRLLGH